MRIAVSGTANTGKTTFIKDFINKWPSYKTPEKTYRDIIVEKNLPHSDKTSIATQRAILDFQVETQSSYSKDDNVIFDRCPLDNLVYSMWALNEGNSDIDEKFIEESIPLVRESMKNLDIIFFIPLTKVAPIAIVDDGMRQANEDYIKEVDYIFKEFQRRYSHQSFEPFFPQNDVPALIEIFGSRQERLAIAGLYIDVDGDAIEGDMESLLGKEAVEELFKSQKDELFKTKNVIFS
jgi:predicted ATPase